jgi:MFS superfamily sulfate permease-like transporter
MQIQNLLGVTGVPNYTGALSSLKGIGYVLAHLDSANGQTAAIGLVSLAALVVAQTWKRRVFKPATATRLQRVLKVGSNNATLLVVDVANYS